MYHLLAVELSAVNDEDVEVIVDLSELTSGQLRLLNKITSEPTSVVGQQTLWDMEILEDFKKYEPEDYERLKQDLYVAVVDEKRCERLDMSWSWAYVSSLFRYGQQMDQLSFTDSSGCQCSINIFSGEPLEPDSNCSTQFYQGPELVLEISKRLSVLNDDDIRQRFESALRKQPPVYGRFSWSEELYPTLLAGCKAVQEFYQSSSAKGFGIVNALAQITSDKVDVLLFNCLAAPYATRRGVVSP